MSVASAAEDPTGPSSPGQGRRESGDVSAITRVLMAVRSAPDPDSIARSALGALREALGWPYGSYWALDASAHTMRVVSESGGTGAGTARRNHGRGVPPR